ncbi:ABC transporter substrate-binding protein [Natrialbaceae archaeon A-arb3/5]
MAQDNNGPATRRSFLTAVGATSVVAVAGCLGGEGPGNGDEIVITQGEFAPNADPNADNSTPTYNVHDQVYEPIFDITADGEVQPHIVEEWDFPDGETVELSVRDDVVFHEGQDMTADDIAYTINRQVQEDVGIASPQVDGLAGILGAEAEDDTTVIVEHEVSPSLAEFGLGVFGRVVSEEWVEEREQPITDEMNGTGPYQVEEFDPGDEQAVYTVFEDYWGETPEIDQVRFQAIDESSTRVGELQTGESDFIVNVPPTDVETIDTEDGVEIRNVTSFRNIFLVMTNDTEPFDSQEFRQAMNYAVDNQGIIDTILGGFGAPMTQPVPEGIFGFNPDLEPYEHDPDQAEELVEESGYEGAEITLYHPEGRYLNDTEIAETAAEQIDELDSVDCTSEIEPFDSLVEMVLDGDPSTSPDFFLIGWGNPTYDSNYGLAPWFVEGQASYNFVDEDVEESIIESQTIEDEDEREEFLQEVNADLREAAPWVYLHLQESIYGVRDDLDWEPRSDESIYVDQMGL